MVQVFGEIINEGANGFGVLGGQFRIETKILVSCPLRIIRYTSRHANVIAALAGGGIGKVEAFRYRRHWRKKLPVEEKLRVPRLFRYYKTRRALWRNEIYELVARFIAGNLCFYLLLTGQPFLTHFL